MKLKIVSLVLLCMLTSAAGYGQQNTAKFNDGTVIDYEIGNYSALFHGEI